MLDETVPTAGVLDAPYARRALAACPGTVAVSCSRSEFEFRAGACGFECRDARTHEGWRPAGPGNLIFNQGELFMLLRH